MSIQGRARYPLLWMQVTLHLKAMRWKIVSMHLIHWPYHKLHRDLILCGSMQMALFECWSQSCCQYNRGYLLPFGGKRPKWLSFQRYHPRQSIWIWFYPGCTGHSMYNRSISHYCINTAGHHFNYQWSPAIGIVSGQKHIIYIGRCSQIG